MEHTMKIIYMGTPDFAVGPLEALIGEGYEITAVVTQPDRPKGRSGKAQISPVKACALSRGIPVLQPQRIKAPWAVEQLRSIPADVFVVAAFGQILSQEILDMPYLGCLCIHASLLPAYRGASPIQQAILNGEERTGVTVMRMDAGVDTGDILTQAIVPIDPQETDESLSAKLCRAGSRLILETLPKLAAGELVPQKQDEAHCSHTKLLTKEMGRIDWTADAAVIERKVRGLYSWPGAYCYYGGKLLKILSAQVCTGQEGAPGVVESVEKDAFIVGTGRGSLAVREVQMEGKKRMAVRDFLNGCRIGKGEKLE